MSQSHHPQNQVPSSSVPDMLASDDLPFTLYPSAPMRGHESICVTQKLLVLWPSILCSYFLPLGLAKDCLLKESGSQ